jgi:hypothetical protein
MLTSGKDCIRDLVSLGGGENKDDMRRGFFERLEKGVECRCGKHVNFIDDHDP